MAISGPEALQSLDDAVRDIRYEEDSIAKRLARSAERVAKSRETEAELFRQLADIRLSPDVRAEMAGRLIQAEERAHEMIARHAKELSDADIALKSLDTQVADQARARRKVLEDIDQAQEKLKALSDKIAKAIAKDPAYEAKRIEATGLDQIAGESMAKSALAETDREQKGSPYRADSLFMYLWAAGYGTKNYRANNLVRWLDSLVARMVRYDDARPNFAMLNDIPLRLRTHAERQVTLARIAEEELDALEQAAIDAAGGKPAREALGVARTQLEKFDTKMSALEDARDARARAFRHLVEGRDPAYEDANNVLAQNLGQQDIRALLADARATLTHEDDAIVAKIDDTRARIAEEEIESGDDKARLKILANRRRELEDIEWEFKKARFDDPRSVFREDDLTGDMLGEFLRGAVTAAVYWGQWRKSQSWRAGTSDWGGGIGLPRSGRKRRRNTGNSWQSAGVSGGGFSRPRAGSRGTRGARKFGGFKTGGGF